MTIDEKNVTIHAAYDDVEPHDPIRPEKNLLLAVLLSAMSDLKQDGDVKRKACEFFLDREEDYLFSFRSICDYLSIDPDKVLVVTGIKRVNGEVKVTQSKPIKIPAKSGR